MEEGSVGCEQMLMTNEESSGLTDPGIGGFDDTATLKASELSAILVPPVLAVVPVRNDEVDATFFDPLTQRIGVLSAVGVYAFRLLPVTAFGSWDFDFGKRGFGKRNFCRRGTFKPHSQRNTATVDSTIHFLPSPCPVLPTADPPFRRSKAAVQKSLFPLQRTIAIQRPQQGSPCVEPNILLFQLLQPSPASRGEGIFVGKKSLCHTCLQNPQDALKTSSVGRPRTTSSILALLRQRKQRLNRFHCASLNKSNRFLLMQEVQQTTRSTQKSSP
jgi:hypothetical protein